MDSLDSAPSNRRLRVVRLGTISGLATLCLAALSRVSASSMPTEVASRVVQETAASTHAVTTTVITFPGDSGPLNTGVYVRYDDFMSITASGEIDNGLTDFTPDGGLAPPDAAYGETILPSIATNSLVGSIGDFATGTLLDDGVDVNPSGISGVELGHPGLFGPGYVGSSFDAIAKVGGNLYLAFNDTPLSDNSGSFVVTVTIQEACAVPFFSQRDDDWEHHPLRSEDNECSSCSTIGQCGCTLTSAAMALNSYGADTSPPQLSDCMDTSACEFRWSASLACSNEKVNRVSRQGFSWDDLEEELNQNHRPVILGMCRRGTCHLGPEAQTHWVVALSGTGNDPEYYLIHDPWYKCGSKIPLATRTEDWEFMWMSVYEGAIPCMSLTALAPPCVNRGANPQPVESSTSRNGVQSLRTVSPSSVVSGTVWVYTRTELTMTVEITAASSLGDVTEMLIWSDTMSNTNWQPFTPFVWLPVSESVYARFRDNLGNSSAAYSDTINPQGPPTAPLEVFVPLIRRG